MAQAFDISLDSLQGRLVAGGGADGEPGLAPTATSSETFFLETFGCQMNDHDSEKVAGLLVSRGYRQVDKPESAKLILYNTCSIREKAAQKVYSRLGEFTGDDGGRIVGVLGCVAQQEGEKIFDRSPWVRLVCGSASYRKLPELLAQLEAGAPRVTGLDNDTDETFETEVTRRDNPYRAFLTIIEGCDKACSYCVVPYTRGPERSRASEAVMRDIRQLAEDGYTEIQLLGQTVNSYRDPSGKMRFSELLLAAADVAGIRRVRYTTSHPRDFTQDIVDAMEAEAKLCNHVHLPVQCGSSNILKAMQRTYSRQEYLERIAMIREARRPISITTDIIVGFPGETQADFEETLGLMEEVRYDGLFAFKYSPRPHTPSLAMKDAVPEEEKGKRLAAVQELQRAIVAEKNAGFQGAQFEVLVSNKSRREKQWSGHTSCNRVLSFHSRENNLLGTYVQVRVTDAGPVSLIGEQVS